MTAPKKAPAIAPAAPRPAHPALVAAPKTSAPRGIYKPRPEAVEIMGSFLHTGTDPVYCQIALIEFYAPVMDKQTLKRATRTLDVLHMELAGRGVYWNTGRVVPS